MSGADWRDIDGNRIEAHEGGVFQKGGTYYLYGTDRSLNNHWFYSINMYSSTDMVHWKFRNRVLAYWSDPDLEDRVVERPKLLYNKLTDKYVMWWHHESSNYGLAEVGVATCDTIDGDYQLHAHFRPRGADSRDMTVYQDTDDKAYLVASVYGNAQSAIYELDPTYTDCPTDAIYSGGAGINGEGHSIIKKDGTYFWFKSGYGGWPPNDNYYSTATSMAGPWTNRGIFVPTGSKSYYSQNYNTMTVSGTQGTTYFFMGDRWHPNAHSQDRTLWLPLEINGTTASMRWHDAWRIDTVTGAWTSGSNTIPNGNYRIVNRVSGKALRSEGWNESPVEQATYSGSWDQQWTITHLGDVEGSYRIANRQSGRVIEVRDNSAEDGGAIEVFDNYSLAHQKWRISSTDSGYYSILNASSRKVLDLPDGSSEEWRDITQWDRKGGDNQEWAIIPIDDVSVPSMPINLNAQMRDGQTGKVRLDWTPVRGATSYQVKRSLSASGPFTPVGLSVIVPSATIDVPGGAAAQYYTVSATNFYGEGANANAVRFHPARLRARYSGEGDVSDTHAGVNNGTNFGVTFGPGRVGSQSLQFNGSNQSVTVPRSIGIHDFTISFWMKTTAWGGSGQWWAGKGIVDAETGGSWHDFGTSLVNDKVAFGVGGPDVTITSTSAVNDGTWHHVAATWNHDTGEMKLYVDGAYEASANGPRGARTTSSMMRIGAIKDATHPNSFFEGSLDEIRLYRGTLGSDDINQLAMMDGGLPSSGVIWEPDGIASGTPGGNGTWNTVNAFWYDNGTMRSWQNTNSDTAVFGGVASNVELAEDVTAGGLDFNNSYEISGTGSVNLTGLAMLKVTGFENVVRVSSNLVGGTLNKEGRGAAIIDGSNILNSVNVKAGELGIAGNQAKNRLSPGATVTVSSGAVVNYLNTNPAPSDSRAASPTFVLNGGKLTATGGDHSHIADLTLNGGTLTSENSAGQFDGERWLLWGDVSVTGTGGSTIAGHGVGLAGTRIFMVEDVSGNQDADLTIWAELNDGASNTGGLTKSGPGTMSFRKNATFTGGTVIHGGVIELASGGGEEGILNGTCTVQANGKLKLSTGDALGYSGTGSRIDILNLNGGTLDVATASNQTLGSAKINLTGGHITGAAGSNLDFYGGNPIGPFPSAVNTLAASSSSTVSGVSLTIRQSAGLTISTENGSAAVDLRIDSSISNNPTFPGAPFVKTGEGTLALNALNTFTGDLTVEQGRLECTSVSNNGNPSSIGAGANIRLGNSTFAYLGNGTSSTDRWIHMQSPSAKIEVTESLAELSLRGSITGSGGFTKIGQGKLSLGGLCTYAGATIVEAGSLNLASSTMTQSQVNVQSGAQLEGSGNVIASLHVAGTVSPGNSIGTLAAGDLFLTGTYACEIDDESSDSLVVTGELNLEAASLDVTLLPGGFTQPYYVIATYGTLEGSFSSVTEGYKVFYGQGVGLNEIWLVAVSSYTTWAATYAGNEPADGDFDQDGVQNGIEFFYGESGSGTTSNPSIDKNGRISWPRDPSAAVASFYIETSSNLKDWTKVDAGDPNLVITSTKITFQVGTQSSASKFCRLVVTPTL